MYNEGKSIGIMGFNACGTYYRIEDYKIGYVDYLKSLIIEIKNNSLKNKYEIRKTQIRNG